MSVNIFIEIGYFINQYPFKYLNYKSQTIPSIGAINENDLIKPKQCSSWQNLDSTLLV